MRFRKKPIIIDAEQFRFNEELPVGACAQAHNGFSSIHVHTLEGTSYDLQDGDWVIRGVHGEYYPCKPDIFKETYEPAE
jgi:hypothetical protein